MRKWGFLLVAAVLLSGGVARADNPRDFGNWFLIKSGDNGFCMDASLDANQRGHEVYIFRCHGKYNQRWTILDNVDHTVSIVGFDGRCLDVTGRSVGDGTPVQLYPCHLQANQKFERRQGMLVERQSGKCLTTAFGHDRSPVFLDQCTGRKEQAWGTFRDY
jgi:Ricin-type beta-trefoil lectin domain